MDLQRQSSSERSPSTAATTPDISRSSPSDDIWASDSEDAPGVNPELHANEPVLSDLPLVKRQHMTDGYREGLSIGKAKIMQQGFDVGYPVGMQIGLRVGKILGSIEGIIAAKDVSDDTKLRVRKLLDKAGRELVVTNLMKGISDEDLMQNTDIPEGVEAVIRKWEIVVFGVASPSVVDSK